MISYNAGTNTILVTGYSLLTPCNFTDIYNADVAGGWGVVSKQGTNQFHFTVKLQIGDGSINTWFADIKKGIRFSGAITTDWQNLIDIKTSGHFRIGEVVDDAKKITKHGCSIFVDDLSKRYFIMRVTSNSFLEVYNSRLDGGSLNPASYDVYIANANFNDISSVKIYNSILHNICCASMSTSASVTLYNLIIENGQIAFYSIFGYIDKITINGMTRRNIGFSNNIGGTFKNLSCKGITDYDIYTYNTTPTCYFVDCDFDRNWIFWWNGTSYPTIYRQNTFNKIIIDELKNSYVGKSWILKDKDGVTRYSGVTQADGKLSATDILVEHGYFNQANGNNEQLKSPYTLWVDGETDYIDLDEKDLNMNIKDIEGKITMVEVSDLVNGINDIKGTGFVKDTDSLVDIRPETAKIQSVKTETDKIQTGIIDVPNNFKATGFATENPPSQNLNDYKANVSNLDVAVSTRNATTPPTVNEIDTQLSGVHGDGSWAEGGGSTPEEIDTELTEKHGAGKWNKGGGGGGSVIVQDPKELKELQEKIDELNSLLEEIQAKLLKTDKKALPELQENIDTLLKLVMANSTFKSLKSISNDGNKNNDE